MTRTLANSELIIFPQEMGEKVVGKFKEFFTSEHYLVLPVGHTFPIPYREFSTPGGTVKPHFEVPQLKDGWKMSSEECPLYTIKKLQFDYEVGGRDAELINNQERLTFLGLDYDYVKFMLENHEAYKNNEEGLVTDIRLYHGENSLTDHIDVSFYTNMEPNAHALYYLLQEYKYNELRINVKGNFDTNIATTYMNGMLNAEDLSVMEFKDYNEPIVWSKALNLYVHVPTGNFQEDVDTILDFYQKGFNVEYTTIIKEYKETGLGLFLEELCVEFTEDGIIKRKWGRNTRQY